MKINWPGSTESAPLSADAIHVWAAPLTAIRAPRSELEVVLSPDERDRARRFVRDEPRRSFVAARAALRSILGRYLATPAANVAITTDPNGKPRLADGADASGLRFNLAHSGDLVLVAVTRGCEVGVDVERIRPVDRCHEIAARYFHPAEQETLRAVDPAQLSTAFLRCWTRKEAVLKAIGVGITHPLDAFHVLSARQGARWVELPAHASAPPTRSWLQDLDPCTGYLAAVAVATTRKSQPPLGFTYYL